MTTLTLVRHGETDWNREGRVQGATDIPLNDSGRAQARRAGALLAEARDRDEPVVVVSSDLSRAAETADLVAAELGTTVSARYPSLRERSYGEAEGLSPEEFAARFGTAQHADVPGAEPWTQLRERALGAIQQVVADARRLTAPAPPRVIAVTHGALIRQVLRHATGDEMPLAGQRLPNGSAFTFLVERERLRLLSYDAFLAAAP